MAGLAVVADRRHRGLEFIARAAAVLDHFRQRPGVRGEIRHDLVELLAVAPDRRQRARLAFLRNVRIRVTDERGDLRQSRRLPARALCLEVGLALRDLRKRTKIAGDDLVDRLPVFDRTLGGRGSRGCGPRGLRRLRHQHRAACQRQCSHRRGNARSLEPVHR